MGTDAISVCGVPDKAGIIVSRDIWRDIGDQCKIGTTSTSAAFDYK